MGPVVSAKQQTRVLTYLEKGSSEGARFLLEGSKASVKGYENGFYVKPALLTGAPENVCAREEIFGPVAYVMRFKEEGEAIDLVNRSRYGLANSVWSRDLWLGSPGSGGYGRGRRELDQRAQPLLAWHSSRCLQSE